MKKVLSTVLLSITTLMSTVAIAGPHDEHRDHSRNTSHWEKQDRFNNQYKNQRINPSRDWRVGQKLPNAFESSRYKVDYKDTRHLNKPSRNQSWYKVNGDYVLVNERNNKIIRIIG